MKKIKLLIISLYYPSVESIASNRIASFTKYLDNNKFDIDIITVQSKGEPSFEKRGSIDIYRLVISPFESYLKIDKSTNSILRKIKALYNILLKKYRFKTWHKRGKEKVLSLQKQKEYDVVLSSYAPEESHLIALALKREYPSIKWIADMRDEMSLNPFLSPKVSVQLASTERDILSQIDALTSVSKPILNDFKTLAKERAEKILFREIRNGYDFEIEEKKENLSDTFTISYLGSFYGEINPNNFLEAMERFIENYRNEKIAIKFIGNNGIVTIPKLLEDKVSLMGFVSHDKALALMKKSDTLLMIHPNTGRKGVYTGKLFEYLAMQKPIIALVDSSDVASVLIQKAHAGFVAEADNIEEILDAIQSAYVLWKRKESLDFNIDIIKMHHRKEQAYRLEKLIEEMV